MSYTRFADTNKIAEQKFQKYKRKDPFPNILPSLLNGNDIADYVRETGMIFPFDRNSLKPATYGLKLCGNIMMWNTDGEEQKINIKHGERFVLPKNSIAFVSLKEELRIPHYLIARFNLKINHVYKGILLGTGPLIDPGFNGILSLPLHNLTNNDYEFRGGETLIWMEFTKISHHKDWHSFGESDKIRLVSTPILPRELEEKDKKDIFKYLAEAAPNKPIGSSLPPLEKQVLQAVKNVKDSEEKIVSKLSQINSLSLIGFFVIVSITATIMIAFSNVIRTDVKEIKDKDYDSQIRNLEQLHIKDSIEINHLKEKVSGNEN